MSVPAVSQYITTDSLKECVPGKFRSQITDGLVDKLNQSLTDPHFAEYYAENLLSFSSVLNDGKYKIDQYLDAVRYVSNLVMGKTKKESYIATFPKRYQSFIDNGTAPKDIASYITSYSKNKLVAAVYEQSAIPVWVYNQALHQQAIMVQADIMTDPKASYTARSHAADSVLNHTKKTEAAKLEVDIATPQGSAIDDLRAATQALVNAQKESVESKGVTIEQIAKAEIVDESGEDDG